GERRRHSRAAAIRGIGAAETGKHRSGQYGQTSPERRNYSHRRADTAHDASRWPPCRLRDDQPRSFLGPIAPNTIPFFSGPRDATIAVLAKTTSAVSAIAFE